MDCMDAHPWNKETIRGRKQRDTCNLNQFSVQCQANLPRNPEFHCGHVFPGSRDLQWAEARERQPLWTKWGLGEGELTVGLQKCSQNRSSVSTLVPMRVKERCYLMTEARIASERL